MTIFNYLSTSHEHAKRGNHFTFHGSFKHKSDAKEKEKETPGSFIREINGRFVVMTENK